MQLISKYNKGIRFLFCVIDIYSKYELDFPLNDKKGITISNIFQKVLDVSGCKPNKIRVDKSNEFYKRSIKSWLQGNNIEMYSIHNERNAAVLEILIGTLKKTLYKYIKNCILIN